MKVNTGTKIITIFYRMPLRVYAITSLPGTRRKLVKRNELEIQMFWQNVISSAIMHSLTSMITMLLFSSVFGFIQK